MGKFISERRKKINLIQKELAKKIYISDKAVSKWEAYKSFPDIDVLEDLALALDVSIVELIKSVKVKKIEADTENLIIDIIELIKVEKKNNKKKSLITFGILVIAFIIILRLLLYFTTPKYDKNLAYSKEYIIIKEEVAIVR